MGYAKNKKPTLKEMNKNMIMNLINNEKFFFNLLIKIGLIEEHITEKGAKQLIIVESKALKLRELLES